MRQTWQILSYWTALVIFFSGVSPVSAESARQTRITPEEFTQKMDKATRNPKFSGCQVVHVLLNTSDLESLEFFASSKNHIELRRLAKQENIHTGDQRVIYRLQSILWVPHSAEFREDYNELRKIETLRFIHCENQNSTSKKPASGPWT